MKSSGSIMLGMTSREHIAFMMWAKDRDPKWTLSHQAYARVVREWRQTERTRHGFV